LHSPEKPDEPQEARPPGAPSHHHGVAIMRSAGTRAEGAPEHPLAKMSNRIRQVILHAKTKKRKTFIWIFFLIVGLFILDYGNIFFVP
jgi:hypothetical protein